MMPKPTDSEKKIWPNAAAHTPRGARAPVGREERVEARPRPRQQQRLDDERRERDDQQRDEDERKPPMPFWTPAP